jgi:hypothetical protein
MHQGVRVMRCQGTRQIYLVSSREEGLSTISIFLFVVMKVAENREGRLVTKTTGACKLVRGCISADACPMPEG